MVVQWSETRLNRAGAPGGCDPEEAASALRAAATGSRCAGLVRGSKIRLTDETERILDLICSFHGVLGQPAQASRRHHGRPAPRRRARYRASQFLMEASA